MSKASSHMCSLENSTKKKASLGRKLAKTVLLKNQNYAMASSTIEPLLLLRLN